jgi:hypothetical protein
MTRDEINAFLDHFTHLLTRPDVTSIDVRAKTTGGKRKSELALVIGVVHKKSRHALTKDVILPRKVTAEGIELPTDVFEEGKLVAAQAEGGGMVQTTGLNRAGSLGVNIQYQGGYNLLSCAHVLTAFDPAFVGAMIQYADSPLDAYANLVPVTGEVAVTYYNVKNPPAPVLNIQDVAWGNITPVLGSPNIKQIGVPAGIRQAVLNEVVQIYGGNSESLETTTVLSTSARPTMQSTYSDGSTIYTFWQNSISLDPATAAFIPGDSGSAVVATSDTNVVGLLFNIGSMSIYACPL